MIISFIVAFLLVLLEFLEIHSLDSPTISKSSEPICHDIIREVDIFGGRSSDWLVLLIQSNAHLPVSNEFPFL